MRVSTGVAGFAGFNGEAFKRDTIVLEFADSGVFAEDFDGEPCFFDDG